MPFHYSPKSTKDWVDYSSGGSYFGSISIISAGEWHKSKYPKWYNPNIPMNIVTSYVPRGLRQWAKAGASVTIIKAGEFSIPRIWLPATAAGQPRGTVLLISGLHLEETSGPILLSQPERVFPLVSRALQAGYQILIYPQVNQWGSQFSERSNQQLLRADAKGQNYNDGWGDPNLEHKPIEVAAVEADILSARKYLPLRLALTLHEDSVTPKIAYVWANKVSRSRRRQLISVIRRHWPYPNQLLTTPANVSAGEPMEDFLAADQRDPGAVEDWLADTLHTPTLTVEAPFSDSLKKRMLFHWVVIKAAVDLLLPS